MCKKLIVGFALVFFILVSERLFAEEIKNFNLSVKDFISLTWDSPGGTFQGYDIYRSSSPEIFEKKINRRIFPKNNYTDYKAGVGEIHYYQVRAVDKEGNTVAISTTVGAYISPFRSGTVWTPTAFQNKKREGEHLVKTKYLFQRKPLLGLNIDFILNYYIGRLFGRNKYTADSNRNDYLTRVGIWLLTSDMKIVFPYFEKKLFSLAFGGRYTYMFRDIPQPSPGAAPEFVIKPGQSQELPSLYLVVSKGWRRNALHLGMFWGKEDEIIPQLSEYIYEWYYKTQRFPDRWEKTGKMFFAGFHTRLIPKINLKMEVLHPLDNPIDPWLVNIDLGRFLPANFQLAYFCYKYGWDILGYFNFRYTFYPPQK